MPSAYKTTAVPVARSQESIRKILRNFNVRGVQFSEDFENKIVSIRFAKEIGGTVRTVHVSMTVPTPPPQKRRRSVSFRRGRIVYNKTEFDRQEQMYRSTYRALHDWLKSQFIAIEFGLLTFEDVFLSHFEWILSTGETSTIGKIVKPRLESTSRLLTVAEGDILGEVIDE